MCIFHFALMDMTNQRVEKGSEVMIFVYEARSTRVYDIKKVIHLVCTQFLGIFDPPLVRNIGGIARRILGLHDR